MEKQQNLKTTSYKTWTSRNNKYKKSPMYGKETKHSNKEKGWESTWTCEVV
jgi:hypothetical protein